MIEIIPAIDIMEGKAVRLRKGDFMQKTVYENSPLEYARQFEDVGIKRLHLVDLDGAKSGKPENLPVLEEIASHTSLQIDFGGGIRTFKSAQQALDAGAAYINVGTVAASMDEDGAFNAWIEYFGAEKFILASDVKNEKVVIGGWQLESTLEAVDIIRRFVQKGIRQVMVTDTSRDGMLQGMNTGLYGTLKTAHPNIFLVASGGFTSTADIDELENAGADAVIIGKAFYEGRVTLEDLSNYLKR
ncbi:MAG: 1-(5-phosphoribosyl)-5-[(5-phosphoribosylamino)methylideneamino]imidazole-4-carboxamide isomerase [Bacteroidales bacterium]|nr:1-(5-phosphoribosyl)-5-[(5-phosphoribosylamino)methylideneamino]imidazole-4-carboxamide isomerase [Bacteroidales bacterium]